MLTHKRFHQNALRMQKQNRHSPKDARFKDVDLTLSPTPTITIIFQVKVPRSNNAVNQFQGYQSNLECELFPAKKCSNAMDIKHMCDIWEGPTRSIVAYLDTLHHVSCSIKRNHIREGMCGIECLG